MSKYVARIAPEVTIPRRKEALDWSNTKVYEITVGKDAQNPVLYFEADETMGMSCKGEDQNKEEMTGKASFVRTSAIEEAGWNSHFAGDLFCAIQEGKGKAAFYTSAAVWQSVQQNNSGQLERADNAKLLLNIFRAAGF